MNWTALAILIALAVFQIGLGMWGERRPSVSEALSVLILNYAISFGILICIGMLLGPQGVVTLLSGLLCFLIIAGAVSGFVSFATGRR
jgi:hypothetical protein